MAARKPSVLQNRHSTKAEQTEQAAAESALTPSTSLRSSPPPALTGRKFAAGTWKRIVALYFEVDGKIVTAFDEDLLVKYCILEEECLAMEKLRDAVLKDFSKTHGRLDKINPKGLELKEYYKVLEQVNALLARYQGLDARLDGKRKLLHALSQSLYLTPRSRAGVAPPQRQPEKPDGFGKEFD